MNMNSFKNLQKMYLNASNKRLVLDAVNEGLIERLALRNGLDDLAVR